MTNRLRRTLLSLATLCIALSANALAAAAGEGEGGPCGFCINENEFFFCEGVQQIESQCLQECGEQHVAECWEEHVNCWNPDSSSFDVWIECGDGFLD